MPPTVYNKDYLGGGATRLKGGLSGDHSWYLNHGPSAQGDYPNGGMSPNDQSDLAFKVYAETGPLANHRFRLLLGCVSPFGNMASLPL